MKKTKTIIVLFILLSLQGCDKLRELATITITTRLETEIPIVVTEFGVNLPGGVNANNAPVQFSVSEILKIEENFDLEPYIKKIKDIDLEKLELTVLGLTQGQSINSVSLDILGIGNIITITNITMTNNKYTPDIPDELFDRVASKLLSDKQVTVTVSGNTSSPISITLEVAIDAKVLAYILN
ncbi:MAG: hypothetical protein Q8S04_04865 [Bacteroidales bacterium]|nr:hypothetical protein [Bacteroidales bacterium]